MRVCELAPRQRDLGNDAGGSREAWDVRGTNRPLIPNYQGERAAGDGTTRQILQSVSGHSGSQSDNRASEMPQAHDYSY